MNETHVTFLFDLSNDWLVTYFFTRGSITQNPRFQFHIATVEEDVQNQDIVFALGCTKKLSPKFLESNRLVLVVHEIAVDETR